MELLKKYIKSSDGLLFFFVLEALAFVSFSLGDLNWIFRYFGFLIALALIPYAIIFMKKEDLNSIIMFSVPLIFYACLTSFSTLTLSAYPLWLNVSVFVGLLSFYFIGLMMRKLQSNKPEYVLASIAIAMGLIVLISLLISIAKYGLFHMSLFQNKYYFFNGVEYPVYEEAKFLYGFEVDEVSARYIGQFGVLLCSAFAGLLFISPKKNKNEFIIICVVGAVGLLSIVLLGNFTSFLFLLPVALFALSFKFLRHAKTYNLIIKIVLALIVLFGFIFVALASFNAIRVNGDYVFSSFHNFILNNAFLNKVFNNITFMQPVNNILGVAFQSDNLFGFNLSRTYIYDIVTSSNSHSIIIEAFKDGGVILVLALIAMIVTGYFLVRKYLKNSNDRDDIKVMIVSFLLAFVIYNLVSYDCAPLIHIKNYVSFSQTMPLLISLFLIGYISISSRDKEIIDIKENDDKELVKEAK